MDNQIKAVYVMSPELILKTQKGIIGLFGMAFMETEIRQFNTLPSLSEDPSAMGLLKAEEQQVLMLPQQYSLGNSSSAETL